MLTPCILLGRTHRMKKKKALLIISILIASIGAIHMAIADDLQPLVIISRGIVPGTYIVNTQ